MSDAARTRRGVRPYLPIVMGIAVLAAGMGAEHGQFPTGPVPGRSVAVHAPVEAHPGAPAMIRADAAEGHASAAPAGAPGHGLPVQPEPATLTQLTRGTPDALRDGPGRAAHGSPAPPTRVA